MKTVSIQNVIFGSDTLGLIAGPCVIESRDHALVMANSIKKISESIGIPVIYKSSFDKANRSSKDGFRGPGVEEGLKILSEINVKPSK